MLIKGIFFCFVVVVVVGGGVLFLHSRCRSVVESNAAAKQEEVTAFNVGFDAHWKSKRLLTEVFLPSKRGVQREKTTDRRETKCQLAKYNDLYFFKLYIYIYIYLQLLTDFCVLDQVSIC